MLAVYTLGAGALLLQGCSDSKDTTPVDCVGNWDEGVCSANCSGGTRSKTFKVSQDEINGGSCPNRDKVIKEDCNMERCVRSVFAGPITPIESKRPNDKGIDDSRGAATFGQEALQIAMNSQGDTLILDQDNNKVRKMDDKGNVETRNVVDDIKTLPHETRILVDPKNDDIIVLADGALIEIGTSDTTGTRHGNTGGHIVTSLTNAALSFVNGVVYQTSSQSVGIYKTTKTGGVWKAAETVMGEDGQPMQFRDNNGTPAPIWSSTVCPNDSGNDIFVIADQKIHKILESEGTSSVFADSLAHGRTIKESYGAGSAPLMQCDKSGALYVLLRQEGRLEKFDSRGVASIVVDNEDREYLTRDRFHSYSFVVHGSGDIFLSGINLYGRPVIERIGKAANYRITDENTECNPVEQDACSKIVGYPNIDVNTCSIKNANYPDIKFCEQSVGQCVVKSGLHSKDDELAREVGVCNVPGIQQCDTKDDSWGICSWEKSEAQPASILI